LIVDNGSEADVIDYLLAIKSQNQRIELLLQENLGGAGGFHNGIKYVVDNFPQIEFLWLMDDDGYPTKNALVELVKASKIFDTTILNSFVVENESTLNPSWPFHKDMDESLSNPELRYFVGNANFFNGTFISKKIINRLGYPIKKLFVKGDELEYYERAKMKLQISLVTVRNSIFIHPSNDESANADISLDKIWHLYFNIRNMFHSHRFNVGPYITNNRFLFKTVKLISYFNYWRRYKTEFLRNQYTNKSVKVKILNLAMWHVVTNKYSCTPNDIKNRVKKYI
jgi:GT2 family glycosyltransferase